MNQILSQTASRAGQYVTVGVGDEVFAVEVCRVREVLDLCPVTRVPNMPAFARGMIDVRGRAVPVLDLRVIFGLPQCQATSHTRIVVIEVPYGGGVLMMGAITDRVYEVIDVTDDGVGEAPELGLRWQSDFIRGVCRRNDAFVILLDLERLFANEAQLLAKAVG